MSEKSWFAVVATLAILLGVAVVMRFGVAIYVEAYDAGLREGRAQTYSEINSAAMMRYLNCIDGPCVIKREIWQWVDKLEPDDKDEKRND